MKSKLHNYKKVQEDLMRQIDLCRKYKDYIQQILKNFKNQYEAGFIDHQNYLAQINEFLEGRHPEEWYEFYDNYIKECYEKLDTYIEAINQITTDLEKKKGYQTTFLIIAAVFFVIGLTIFLRPPITGFVTLDKDVEEGIVFEDGYTVEGESLADIKGSRIYERCLKVYPEITFDTATLMAKVISTTKRNDLTLSLYNHNEQEDEPADVVSSCKVNDYDNVWKSCTVKDLQQSKDTYWICAASLGGDGGQTDYLIDFSIGSDRRTALWTGEHWQKLDRSLYAIKAQFKQNEK